MSEQWAELFKQLPNYLGGHIMLSLTSLAVGLAISVPLGIAVSRQPRLAELTLTVAGIIQTIPSLALLALMVLVLGMIGFEPAFVALTLYSILPILAGTVAGIRGVDPTLVEAARGLGMSERQMLLRVQLPLAAPVIISGIRTATVMVVGTATLVSPVGGRSLGNYIFQGLESLNHESVLLGCVLVAMLAIILDQLVHLLELAAQRRSGRLAWLAVVGLAVILVIGIYPLIGRYVGPQDDWVHIGSGPFTEQHILSEVLQRQLESAGFQADKRKSMSEGIQFMALRNSEIACMVNYTGNIWVLLMGRGKFPADRAVMLEEIERYLRDDYGGVVCLGPLGFENAYRFAMHPEVAKQWNVTTMKDLKECGPQLRLASDFQFLGRPDWFSVRREYQLRFRRSSSRSMDPALMYEALRKGEVDVITAYTSDGRLDAFGLKVLDDPARAFPPYEAVLLVSPRAAQNKKFIDVLRPLIGCISEKTMRDANRQVDVGKSTPARAAEHLLQKVAWGQK
jgi:osmoprotectant transport system permease protein